MLVSSFVVLRASSFVRTTQCLCASFAGRRFWEHGAGSAEFDWCRQESIGIDHRASGHRSCTEVPLQDTGNPAAQTPGVAWGYGESAPLGLMHARVPRTKEICGKWEVGGGTLNVQG
jgi:hypothetical protein